MENSKVGCEESDSADLQQKQKQKQKPCINKNHNIVAVITAEKLKRDWSIPKSSRVDQCNLWATGTMIFILWFGALQWSSFQNNTEAKAMKYHKPRSVAFPRQRYYANNGYLMISPNGGLNQMRAGICDMVAIARYLNVTLIVPEMDNISFWHDASQFEDIFDVDYFIKSLRDQVRILQQLPLVEKRRLEIDPLYSMAPSSWSSMLYYNRTILPRFEKYKVVHFTKTDTRLANNGIPEEIQKLRCRVMYEALRFASPIEKVGKKLVRILRKNGPFLALHLRYEMDVLAFSGCTEGCTKEEATELKKMRYACPWWKVKEINAVRQRGSGSCPLTPEETALTLRALEINTNIRIYIAAGEIYGGERRMAGLKASYPNLVRKESLLAPSDLEPFKNHSNQMAALDYIVSLASDIFVPTYGGNMAKVVEGHRRYLGYKATINPDRFALVHLIDQYKNGTLSWNEFSESVKAVHGDRMGGPTQRIQVPGKPKEEDYFYSNPKECLPPIFPSSEKKKPSAVKENPS